MSCYSVQMNWKTDHLALYGKVALFFTNNVLFPVWPEIILSQPAQGYIMEAVLLFTVASAVQKTFCYNHLRILIFLLL